MEPHYIKAFFSPSKGFSKYDFGFVFKFLSAGSASPRCRPQACLAIASFCFWFPFRLSHFGDHLVITMVSFTALSLCQLDLSFFLRWCASFTRVVGTAVKSQYSVLYCYLNVVSVYTIVYQSIDSQSSRLKKQHGHIPKLMVRMQRAVTVLRAKYRRMTGR